LILNINSLFFIFVGKFFPLLSFVNLRHRLRVLDFLIVFHLFFIIFHLFLIIVNFLRLSLPRFSPGSKKTSEAAEDGRGYR
jgi:hypothetical protein